MQNAKNAWNRLSALVTFALLMAFGASASHAALPTEVTDLFTDVAADAALLFAAAVVLWGGIRGFFAIMKLGNKMISKAGA